MLSEQVSVLESKGRKPLKELMAKAAAGPVGRTLGFGQVPVTAVPMEAFAEDGWGHTGSFLRCVSSGFTLCMLTDLVIDFR